MHTGLRKRAVKGLAWLSTRLRLHFTSPLTLALPFTSCTLPPLQLIMFRKEIGQTLTSLVSTRHGKLHFLSGQTILKGTYFKEAWGESGTLGGKPKFMSGAQPGSWEGCHCTPPEVKQVSGTP
eukprot:2920881-Amphidinium_carterae.1